ncbi:hypothetical protein N7535_000060 [Penicillium sp. DV-2018c]|nr:hypothetical protein N7535_000060 [Penicillium sp. DV-2018c]
MATVPPHTPDRPLGESWLIASTPSLKKEKEGSRNSQAPVEGRNKTVTNTAAPDSVSLGSSISSSWTVSGPELIMPAICETPNAEGSWIERERTPTKSSSNTMRKRRNVSLPDGTKLPEQDRTGIESSDTDARPSTDTPTAIKSPVANSQPIYRDYTFVARTSINAFLIAMILHLLVLPEVVYQAKGLCQLPSVKKLYPSSCIILPATYPPQNPFHSPSVPQEETLATSQQQLESILDTALETLSPLSSILKQSESMLADLEIQLKSTFPDVRNALDLEFTGSNQAIQAAVWEFDSLRADLRSAIDSLLSSPPTPGTGGTVALDTRLANQQRRRSEYLDRLRAQIRSKADSLNARFTTLDDHLEAVDGIVSREERRSPSLHKYKSSHSDDSSDPLHSVLGSLPLGPFGAYLTRRRSSGAADANVAMITESESESSAAASVVSSEPTPRPATTLALLRIATTHHRPVADSVLRLSRQLHDMRRATGTGSTW